ncbi:MAG TPA: S9 family peptidase, partial [Ktedonobacteraceae bacterium]|nr:S9 family peptidase [Ktedonobacteraceae bacterium]
LICIYQENGEGHLVRLNSGNGEAQPLELPYTNYNMMVVSGERAAFLASSPTEFTSLIELNLATNQLEVVRRNSNLILDKASLSVPEAIEFPTEHGLTAYAFYYAPRNANQQAPEGELPPLLVISHGGPTSATTNALLLSTQYWTSRGFAVLDVNYGGSTGYGRTYRQRLNGQFGIVDTNDCINGAKYLVEKGLVDPKRLAIKGGSAGGYTTLCALAFHKTFNAGGCHFGVSDPAALARDTHKFESRYMDSMVGPYPEMEDVYKERTPILYADQISCPVIFFQGLDDRVVTPDQSELMVNVLRENKLPVAYIAYEGEGHGFRMAKNIKRTFEAESYFFARVFGFELADQVEPVEIYNM